MQAVVVRVRATGPQGPPGPAGIGSAWHRGAGVPAAGLGSNGDYYLNTTNGDIYGPKAGGAWGAVVFNIAEGQEGPPGPTGPAGVVNTTAPITYNSGTQTVGINIGTTAGTAAAGNDPRFTDAREWSADTITQTEAEAGTSTTRRAFTAARVFQAIAAWWAASTAKVKLDGIASGATANATDAQLRDRSTHTGTQHVSTITGLAAVASSGAYGDLSGRPDLTLKADLVGGVIPSSQIPAIAISDYLGSAASQAAMLALNGQRGDWCIRTDGANAGAWILAGEPSSTLENWVRVPMPAVPVQSVNGQVGAVTLGPADVGAAAASHTQPASTITGLGTLATQSGTFSGNSSGTNTGDVTLAASVADVLSLSGQELQADDPGGDRILFWDDSESRLRHLSLGPGVTIIGTTIYGEYVLGLACSDETSLLTTGTAKITFRMPFPADLIGVRANLTEAPTGSALVVDINEGGVSVLSTKLSIDAGEETSVTAATPAVISDTALADDAKITADIDQIGSAVGGAGKGLKLWLYLRRTG